MSDMTNDFDRLDSPRPAPMEPGQADPLSLPPTQPFPPIKPDDESAVP
jgi:hypothetical protein